MNIMYSIVRFVLRRSMALLFYGVAAVAISVMPMALPIAPEGQLAVFHGLIGLSLPFIVVPVPRWLMKLTLHQMRNLTPSPTPADEPWEVGEPIHFVQHLGEGNLALVSIRCAYIIATTVMFVMLIEPWLYAYQTRVVLGSGAFTSRVLFGLMMYGSGVGAVVFGAANTMLVVRLFNIVTTRRMDEFRAIVRGRNVAVGLLYATLLLCVFGAAGSVYSRIVGIVLG